MKENIKNLVLLIYLLLTPFYLCCEEKKDTEKKISYEQTKDSKSFAENYSANSLKQLNKFNFFAGFPAGSNNVYEEIRKEIQNELKKHGKLTNPELIARTIDGKEALDPTIFTGDASMKFRLQDVYSTSGEKLGFVTASLSIETQVSIDTTKINTNGCIWEKSCFLPGSTGKDLKGLVKTSLLTLLKDFSTSYKDVNNESPSFVYAEY